MILFHENPKYLNLIHDKIKIFLNDKLKLTIHPRKKIIDLIEKGFDFTGYVIKPGRMLVRRTITNRSLYKARKWKKLSDKFSEHRLEELRSIVNGYLGLAVKADSYNYRKKLCSITAGNLFVSADKDYRKIILN